MSETVSVISPWVALLFAVPVLLIGEQMAKRVPFLGRFNIPAPVAGGLTVAITVLLINVYSGISLSFATNVTARWWTWIVCVEPEWMEAPAKNITQPMLVAFFACIGLNASWSLLRRGTLQVFFFVCLVTGVVVLQNIVGIVVARSLGASQLLGMICGSVTMTGGHGTMMGFAPEFQRVGLESAAEVGAAAATFGLVAGGLLGGPVGSWLIRGKGLESAEVTDNGDGERLVYATGIIPDIRRALLPRSGFWRHLLVIALCVKLGAWVSKGIELTGVSFPVYMGALLLGVAARNISDAFRKNFLKTRTVDRLSAVFLGLFLTTAMMSLNLVELRSVAGPMLGILVVQVALIAVVARYVIFYTMGRDYDAAVMAAGLCGFGLGAMPNAIANMKALTERYGSAARAFLVVPITGTFLIDITNAFNITIFLNLLG